MNEPPNAARTAAQGLTCAIGFAVFESGLFRCLYSRVRSNEPTLEAGIALPPFNRRTPLRSLGESDLPSAMVGDNEKALLVFLLKPVIGDIVSRTLFIPNSDRKDAF